MQLLHGDSSVPSVCDCRGPTNNFHKYFHHNKLQVMVMWLRSVTVVDRQAIFTGTSTEISCMEVALCLQSVTVVDQQATFTGTTTRISSM